MLNVLASSAQVYNLLPVKELQSYHYGPNVHLDDPLEDCITLKNIVVNGITYSPLTDSNEDDTYSILKVNLLACLRSEMGEGMRVLKPFVA